jgi:hypothetical protein
MKAASASSEQPHKDIAFPVLHFILSKGLEKSYYPLCIPPRGDTEGINDEEIIH